MRFASCGSAKVASLLAAFVVAAPAFAAKPAHEAPAPSSAAAWRDALSSMALPTDARLVVSPDGLETESAERMLRSAGYVPAVSIPPSLHVVRAEPRHAALPAGFVERPLAIEIERGTAGAAGVDGGASAPMAGPAGDPFRGLADALPPRRADPRGAANPSGAGASAYALPTGLFFGTRWEDLSEFMVGRVAIGILFPESDGTLDPNQYDWTPALRDSVIRSAVRGFYKWSALAASQGIPLSYHLEIHPSIPTRYEPISRPVAQEELWIEDVLRQLVGYRGDATQMGTEFANGLRGRLGAHWGGLVLAVQNDSSSTGTFPDGLVAHANLGGPWFVIPVNNALTTSATLDYYMGHEVAHLFWALDEYPAVNAWWSCTLTTGYFERPNYNSSIPFPGYCLVDTRCLMRGNYPDDTCSFTRQQVGWVDLDQNSAFDLFETHPSVIPDSTRYRTGAGNPLVLRGKAGETAWPNRNPYRFYSGDSISVSVVDSAFYRVDGGPWTSIPPLDGIFDSGEERFEIVLDPLPIGNHTIEWDARNRNGKSVKFIPATAVTISGSTGSIDPPAGAPTAPLRLAAGPVPSGGSVRFTLDGGPAGAATVRVWSASGSLVREWRVAASRPLSWTWDGRLSGGRPAPNGVYFATVDAGGERAGRRLVLVR
ncbi:MAG TPA: FlgD immunoglobulin-like domain containing protein [Candidatus Eisenbacteria bacterium]|nr:FlgD immunoglobulin-like domain containing protein [Candidatus Eisenbacteria bacterium]